jgi:predicted alpha/beta-fold hydrolase
MDEQPFIPFPLLDNAHLMTMAAAVWPRFISMPINAQRRLFAISDDSSLLAYCHWQSERQSRSTLLILHGMEGDCDSHYVLGLASKAFASGMNVLRLNMRGCGGTLHLTPALYHGGMSQDVLKVLDELQQKDELLNFCLAGFSLGGNIILKTAAELGEKGGELLSAVCAISPAVDLAACVEQLQRGFNRFYEKRFLRSLRAKLKEKSKLYPDLYDLSPLELVKTVRDFDETYTAPIGGFSSADDYYARSSALSLLSGICTPTLIIQAQDDPLVPFSSFVPDKLNNKFVTMLAPEHGGHGGFVQREVEQPPVFDRFWAENRAVNFCLRMTDSTGGKQS